MKIKKILFISLLPALILGGCTLKKAVMDVPVSDGSYHYQNKDLGFSLVLPADFIYYQTQRTDTTDYVDLEIFVPTSDTGYVQEVPGYAKPIAIRVYKNKEAWEKHFANPTEVKNYQQLGSQGDKVYTIRYWTDIPIDWQGKWNQEMAKKIASGFKIN
ncbi:MAG: hypothetical protein NTW06_04570 [Candidatus Falkowbacteria bacterium]|nr:hypothetical protein [Candidatus Falkowbacteria bacterium]